MRNLLLKINALVVISMFCWASLHAVSGDAPAAKTAGAKIKAYKSLTFDDTIDESQTKLASDIIGGELSNQYGERYRQYLPFWQALFGTDEEFASYHIGRNQFARNCSTQMEASNSGSASEELRAIDAYFQKTTEISQIQAYNKALKVNCWFLKNRATPQMHSGLAFVEVKYMAIDNEQNAKMVRLFTESHPNAKKDTKHFLIQSSTNPYVSLQFDRDYYVDSSTEVESRLSVPPEKFGFICSDFSKMSDSDKVAVGEIAKQQGSTAENYLKGLGEQFSAVEQRIANSQGDKGKAFFDELNYNGWERGTGDAELLFLPIEMSFKSKSVLGYHTGLYRDSLNAARTKRENELKAQKESAESL